MNHSNFNPAEFVTAELERQLKYEHDQAAKLLKTLLEVGSLLAFLAGCFLASLIFSY